MNSGEYRQRLIFKNPDEGTDEDGFPVSESRLYTKAWAKLKTLRGKAFYAAAQPQKENTREFTIRYQSKLLDTQRPKGLLVFWRGKEHTIESIEDDDGLRKTMTVIVRVVR